MSYSSGTGLSEVDRFYDHEVVLFDLKTSGFTLEDDLLQIAARTRYNDKSNKFQAYIRPRKPIKNMILGFHTVDGCLHYRNERVNAVSAARAFKLFLKYLQSLNGRIVLVAHQGIQFDAPRIVLLSCRLRQFNKFKSLVRGFSDSIPILKLHLPERKQKRLSFKLKFLTLDVLDNGHSYDLWNASATNAALDRILDVLDVEDSELLEKATKTIKVLKDMRSRR